MIKFLVGAAALIYSVCVYSCFIRSGRDSRKEEKYAEMHRDNEK